MKNCSAAAYVFSLLGCLDLHVHISYSCQPVPSQTISFKWVTTAVLLGSGVWSQQNDKKEPNVHMIHQWKLFIQNSVNKQEENERKLYFK